MTEIELVEAITLHMSVSQTSGNSSLAMLFGYLIAAYAIGRSLTTLQAAVFTALYLLSIAATIAGGFGAVSRARHYAVQLQELQPNDTIYLAQVHPGMSYFVMLACIFGSLWFMWSVRHPKIE